MPTSLVRMLIAFTLTGLCACSDLAGDSSVDAGDANTSDANTSADAANELDARVIDTGIADAATSEPDAAQRDAASEPDASEPLSPLPKCTKTRISKLGSVEANTDDSSNAWHLSCASGASNDTSFYFVVPATAYYEISTKGTSFDNSLALMSASCNGSELACDAQGSDDEALIVRKLKAKDDYLIVVDGNGGSHGAVELSVNRVSCPDVDLSEQTLPYHGSTSDGANMHDGSCGGTAQREKSLLWTAPNAGVYTFTVSSSAFDAALYVERGLRCGGELLGCSAGAKGFARAAVTRRLAKGESVTLIVDSVSGSGAFDLDVVLVPDAVCPGTSFDPMNDAPVMRSLAPTDPSLLTGSCLPAEQKVVPGGTYALADHSYQVVVPAGFGCNVRVEGDRTLGLYVLSGVDCAGAESSCTESTQASGPFSASVSLGDFTANTSSSWTVVVENANPNGGTLNYTLSGSCFAP